MDLQTWISSELIGLRNRLTNGVMAVIPNERRGEQLDDLSIAPTYALWHMTRHHDVAVNLMIRGVDEVVHQWTDTLGVSDDLWRGLAEAQDHSLLELLDPAAVDGYAKAVIDTTVEWLETADLADLDRAPDTAGVLDSLGTPQDRFDWLYSMWEGKPVSFFLQWEAVGHGYNHLGELISVRNRMGLSPF